MLCQLFSGVSGHDVCMYLGDRWQSDLWTMHRSHKTRAGGNLQLNIRCSLWAQTLRRACRESIQVKKRVLIRGSGALGEASLDFRGNSPAFRFRSNSVLLNLEIDFSGFREAVRFEEQTGALMHRCIIK